MKPEQNTDAAARPGVRVDPHVSREVEEKFAERLCALLTEFEARGLHPQAASVVLVDNALAAIQALRWRGGDLNAAMTLLSRAAARLAM